MATTTFLEGSHTLTYNGHPAVRCPAELTQRYDALLSEQRLNWTAHQHLDRLLGSGGQGVVYLSRAPRHRQLHAAGGAEDLLARALR